MAADDSANAPAAVILGSAFSGSTLGGRPLRPEPVDTPYGPATLHRVATPRGAARVLFRHGAPHRLLPHQVPYLAHAWALRAVGCRALLITSSVGVLDGALPLFVPLPIGDLLMLDNRLPDGRACSIFTEPTEEQGHLVVDGGLFDPRLSAQLATLADSVGSPLGPAALFAYVGGPRTKTPAENALLAAWGAQINSMSVGPEVVLANELQIPCCGLAVGHKYSGPASARGLDAATIDDSLARSRAALEAIALAFLDEAAPVPFGNRIHRVAAP